MSDPLGLRPAGAPPATPPVAPAAVPQAAVPTVETPGPAAARPTDQIAALPRRESAASAPVAPDLRLEPPPARRDRYAVDWGRVAIHAGMLPLAYPVGLFLHERVGHGVTAQAFGATDVSIHMLPDTYTRTDGSTGIRFGYMTYHEGENWGPKERALVSMGPYLLDTAILASTSTLFETGNWPRNPWASGGLMALHAAAVFDLANAAQGTLIHPDNESSDTVRAARLMGIHPRVLGAVEGAVAVAGAVELVRIARSAFRKEPERAQAIHVSAAPTVGGAGLTISGSF